MSDTVLKKIDFMPGFNKNTTAYSAENYWVDGDKIRFRNMRPEKIGGWVREYIEQVEDPTNNMFTGTARAGHTWVDLQFNKYLAIGTEKKIELMAGSQVYDITPYRASTTLTDAVTTNGTTSVQITDTAHDASEGDYIYIDSQASAVDGVTLSGQYEVASVIDVDNFTVTVTTAATGSTSLAGGALEINYLLENGEVDNGNLTGYSGSTYGTPSSDPQTPIALTNAITTNGTSTVQITDTAHGLSVGDEVVVVSQASAVDGIDLEGDYEVTSVIDANNYTIVARDPVTLVETVATGSTSTSGGALSLIYGATGWNRPRAGVGGSFLRQTSFDNWGEDLIACIRGGKVYQWDASSGAGTRLTQITNSPEENYIALVAQPSRHLAVFGTVASVSGLFDPLTIRWASQETLTEWSIESTNTAGEYRLPLGNYIVAVVQTKLEIIILTDNTVYSMRYVGGNEVFRFDIVATNTSAVSQHCAVNVNEIVYWQGLDDFYMYDGVVRPLNSSLEEYVFDQDSEGLLNFDQKEKVYCGVNKAYSEIMWLYPAGDSLEINRYVILNFADNLWYDGTLERTIWVDKNVFDSPFALNAAGQIYAHEIGVDDDGSPMEAYITSGDLDLDEGEKLMFVDKFIPDFKLRPNRGASVTISLKKYPNSTPQVKGPYTFDNNTNKISFRARARHASITYTCNTLGADFEVGTCRFSVQPDGER